MNEQTAQPAQPKAVLSSAELGPKPAAWRFQQATYGVGDVRGRGWLPALKFTKPGWECMQKDVEPLYDQAALDAAVAAALERAKRLAGYALSCAKNNEWSAAEDAIARIDPA